MNRRDFVGSCLTASAAVSLYSGPCLSAGEFDPVSGILGQNPLFDALRQLGADKAQTSESIRIKVPALAEDGASVAVSVSVKLEGVQRLALLAEKNPRPLVADVNLLPGSVPFLSTRIRLSDDSDVIALVWTDVGLFMSSKRVAVAVGGCGKG